jgi:hypothetical protein
MATPIGRGRSGIGPFIWFAFEQRGVGQFPERRQG